MFASWAISALTTLSLVPRETQGPAGSALIAWMRDTQPTFARRCVTRPTWYVAGVCTVQARRGKYADDL